MNVKKRIDQLKRFRQNRIDGKFNCIPFYYHFPRLSKFIPGLFKGCLYTILSATGIGKSKFARFLNIIIPYEISKKNSNFKFETIFFSLEESKEEFIDNMIIYVLNYKFNISIDRLQLNSMYESVLDDNTIERIEDCQDYVNDLMQYVTIIDNVDNPTGIYMYCRDRSNEVGKHFYKDEIINNKKTKVYSHYELNEENKDKYFIVVVDHISLLGQETDKFSKKRLSLGECMTRWSSDYALKQITKHWGWIVCNVQQTTMTSDDAQHFKLGKLEPEISDAADNKRILRDSKLVISLFAASRYNLKEHRGYDITKMMDWYRDTKILKNRYGLSNIAVGMLFDGAKGTFEELPPVSEIVSISKLYKWIQNKN
jgi:energy-coupling factor transporter ATP-binding protein EcfA2